jgi:hypothetical protein
VCKFAIEFGVLIFISLFIDKSSRTRSTPLRGELYHTDEIYVCNVVPRIALNAEIQNDASGK